MENARMHVVVMVWENMFFAVLKVLWYAPVFITHIV